jgi:23S rRNA pseudouridine1911/1915/1917 synthase
MSGPGRLEAERLERATPRQALHAAELVFKHPVSGTRLAFRSEWPQDLVPALDAARGPQAQVAPAPGLTYFEFFTYHPDE